VPTVSVSDTTSIISAFFVIVTFCVGRLSVTRTRSAKEQHTDDKLDSLIESMREVTSGIKEINRKLDDHGIAIAKHTEQISTLFARIERLERNCDMHRGVGGSD
jgi:hypothetical protein